MARPGDDRALIKDADQPYQRRAEMAVDLRAVVAHLQRGAAARA